jgi:hypothetical protein
VISKYVRSKQAHIPAIVCVLGPKNFDVVLDHVVVEKDNQMYMMIMMKY